MENFQIIKPFGPSIVKIKMSSEMISEINNYVDLIIRDKEKSKNLDEGSNLIGKVQQEFLMELDFMKKIKWAEFLASAVSKWVLEEQNKKIDWETYFMSISILASIRSNCERLHVGCILVKNKRIISMGYNGFLSGAKHESIVRNNHEQATVHAEQNAITDAASRGVNIHNSIAYITHFPCLHCFKLLVASKIKQINYIEDYKNDKIVYKLARELHIVIKQLKPKMSIV